MPRRALAAPRLLDGWRADNTAKPSPADSAYARKARRSLKIRASSPATTLLSSSYGAKVHNENETVHSNKPT
ncbi:hypothetical protein Mkiyose1665_46700 [Mycobacterium kiyosense]|uniref:Uncharacterized protein n=1 Tax=Mycobacterium kiyosense TaxID=2871094 RepID=A0A9P3QC83_9MYCO|nr:hypothetical protein IWGMT90018_62100 [Mycobacterium kiyosense]BDE11374.1 hypothetical protein MKCMC460_02340 [Mycobacterium sp. 20KCMC460]GLB86255.1 hypothetical protein SRL2020028_55110 [Mycobacterium kiyosense]GLB92823.1 hypothetical protein SRL2020130_56400 [Mycobacterium kiyosense]GLB98829.1 hypothetical protein SRL2020226_56050 [Mycobacterium kiyosense]